MASSRRLRIVLVAVGLVGAVLVMTNREAWSRDIATVTFLVFFVGNIGLSYREEGAGRLDRPVRRVVFYAAVAMAVLLLILIGVLVALP
jgi:hypothetical protein